MGEISSSESLSVVGELVIDILDDLYYYKW
jgi:hypothetical protein